MKKETLKEIKNEITDMLLKKINIDECDRVELLINLTHFFNNYDENIEILKRVKSRTIN